MISGWASICQWKCTIISFMQYWVTTWSRNCLLTSKYVYPLYVIFEQHYFFTVVLRNCIFAMVYPGSVADCNALSRQCGRHVLNRAHLWCPLISSSLEKARKLSWIDPAMHIVLCSIHAWQDKLFHAVRGKILQFFLTIRNKLCIANGLYWDCLLVPLFKPIKIHQYSWICCSFLALSDPFKPAQLWNNDF